MTLAAERLDDLCSVRLECDGRQPARCPQVAVDGGPLCYYHRKVSTGQFTESHAYTVLTAKQWKEVYANEIPVDPSTLDDLVYG